MYAGVDLCCTAREKMTNMSTVNDVIEMISRFSGGRLRDTQALARFLLHAESVSRPAAIGDLAFQGKYLTRLLDTLRKNPPGSEHYDGLEHEFSRALNDFQDHIRDFSSGGDRTFLVFVEAHYLSVTESALKHVLMLAYDFGWLKEWELAIAAEEGGLRAP